MVHHAEGDDAFIPLWVNNYPVLVQTKTTMTVSTLRRCSESRLHLRLRHSARPLAFLHLEDDFQEGKKTLSIFCFRASAGREKVVEF